MTGDPGFLQLALNEAYNFANIGFDHATETICIINLPLGATAKPLCDNEAGNRKPLHCAHSHGVTRPGTKRCENEGDGDRTRNLRIDSPVL